VVDGVGEGTKCRQPLVVAEGGGQSYSRDTTGVLVEAGRAEGKGMCR
jgi:hypothetical protein